MESSDWPQRAKLRNQQRADAHAGQAVKQQSLVNRRLELAKTIKSLHSRGAAKLYAK